MSKFRLQLCKVMFHLWPVSTFKGEIITSKGYFITVLFFLLFFLLDHTVKHSLWPSNSLLNFFTPTLLICFFYVSSNMARKYWWYKLSFVRAGTTTTYTYHKIYSFTENGYQTLTYLLNLNADVAIFNSFTCNFMED